MQQYKELLQDILENGDSSDDRTGVGTTSVFGRQIRFNLKDGFPLLTAKHTSFKMIATELLWMLSGDTNVKALNDQGNKIWNEWATESGELGPVYGKQWRAWHNDRDGCEVDQIANVIESLKSNPKSRRHIVSAWNVNYLPDERTSPSMSAYIGFMALPPCHLLFQFNARKLSASERRKLIPKGTVFSQSIVTDKEWHRALDLNGIPSYELSCQLYQRSADMFLGVPYNIASYALLTHMVAQLTNMTVGDFVHTFGDAHIYNSHLEKVEELLSRDFDKYDLPKLNIVGKHDGIDDFTLDSFEVVSYQSQPSIKAPIAV